MPEPLTADDRHRWADVGRRILELGPGTHAIVQRAIANRPVPLPPLHAAEACLDELETIPGEPDAIDVNP